MSNANWPPLTEPHIIAPPGAKPITQEVCYSCGQPRPWWSRICCGASIFRTVIVGYQWTSASTIATTYRSVW